MTRVYWREPDFKRLAASNQSWILGSIGNRLEVENCGVLAKFVLGFGWAYPPCGLDEGKFARDEPLRRLGPFSGFDEVQLGLTGLFGDKADSGNNGVNVVVFKLLSY